jgi:anti-anti-sigma factor
VRSTAREFRVEPEQVKIESARRDGVVVIKVAGEVDFGNVARLREALLDGAGDGSVPARVVLDLGAVTFLDSMGLSVLIQGKRHIEDAGGEMSMEDPSPRVRRVFELAGVEEYLLG